MHSLMLIMLEDAYRAASLNHWRSADLYLRSALGLANSLHDKRRACLILRSMVYVRKASRDPVSMIQHGPIVLSF